MQTAEEECAPGRNLVAYLSVIAAVAVLTLLTLWGSYEGGTSGGQLIVDVVVALLSIGLAPVIVRWPVAGVLALGVLAALSPAATPGATIAVLLIARQRPFRTALLVALVGVAGHAVQGSWRPAGGLSYGWWLLLIVAAYAAIVGWGALAQAQADRLIALRERARRAETEQERRVVEARLAERARMAREMHDVLAHRLSLVATYAGALEYRPDASPEQLSRAAGVVRAGVHQALDELRQVITVLRADEAELDHPAPALADVRSLVDESRQAGATVTLDFQIRDDDLTPCSSGRTAYRIVQEGLTNARKHAAGQPVSVRLDGRRGERLRIEMNNSLCGQAVTPPSAGAGLVGLGERVALAGGQIDHRVTDSGEFELRAWLPWST
jgi:signal transduction histidine kinase